VVLVYCSPLDSSISSLCSVLQRCPRGRTGSPNHKVSDTLVLPDRAGSPVLIQVLGLSALLGTVSLVKVNLGTLYSVENLGVHQGYDRVVCTALLGTS
jgi:hypothetical protein